MVEAVVVHGNPRCDGDTCRSVVVVVVVVVEPVAEVVADRGSMADGRGSVPIAVSGSCVWLWNQTRLGRPRRHRSPGPAGRGCASPSRHHASVPVTAVARAAFAIAVDRTVAADRRLIATYRKQLRQRPLLQSSVCSTGMWKREKEKNKTVRTSKGKKKQFRKIALYIIVFIIFKKYTTFTGTKQFTIYFIVTSRERSKLYHNIRYKFVTTLHHLHDYCIRNI